MVPSHHLRDCALRHCMAAADIYNTYVADKQLIAMGTVDTLIQQDMSESDFRRSLLRSIALFRDVEPQTVSDLLNQSTRMDIKAGELLLSPDRANDCVYIVLSGGLEVRLGSRDAQKVANITIGCCAGEMSLIESRDPSAWVFATEESHLMVFSHELLWRMVDRSHAFAKNLLVVLSERVRSDNEFIASSLGVLKRAERNANTDALTGVNNRHGMQSLFARELERSQRDAAPVALMMIDVDHFKRLNDRHGHVAGDSILAMVAAILREHLRPTDLIARFGGDEFSVMLPSTTAEQTLQTAERLRRALQNAHIENTEVPITISVGVTIASPHDDLESLVQRADVAMYQAKAKGRDRVAIIDPPLAGTRRA